MKSGTAIACLCILIIGCNPAPDNSTSEKPSEMGPSPQANSRPVGGIENSSEKEPPPTFMLGGLPINEEYFIIQVAAVSDEKTAKRVSADLEISGYPAVLEKVQRADGKYLIRIRTGVFRTPYEATYSLENLRDRFKEAVLIKLDRAPQGEYEPIRVDTDSLSQVNRSIFYEHKLKYCRRFLAETTKRCLSEIADREFMAEADKNEWKQHFIKSQGLWEELLKADTKAMEMEMYGGSGAGLTIQSYQIRHTAQRILTLKERYGLD